MAYISNTTNEIVVDAILTSEGRKKLSTDGKLNVTKFALSDDEIDYALYNTSNPNGSDDYDIAIRKLPILEALPKQISPLKYKLYYDSDQSSATTLVQAYTLTVNIDSALRDGSGYANQTYNFSPGIRTAGNEVHNETYYYVQLFGGESLASIKIAGVVDSHSNVKDAINENMTKYSGYNDRAVGSAFKISCIRVMNPDNFSFTVVPFGKYAGVITPTDSSTLSTVLYIGGVLPGITT